MEKTNILKRVLAATMLLLVAIPSWCADGDTFTANTIEGVEMTFKVISESEKTCQVGDGSNCAISSDYSGEITIPSSANGYSVTAIGENAFPFCESLTSITIPSSVMSLGASAFIYCTSLSSITIPEGVTSIEPGVFGGCSGLSSITIPESVTTIGVNAFAECSGLTSITIPLGVTSIGNYAFRNCSGLTSITIPSSVTSIGELAFEDCSGLTSITIPEKVTYIGPYAFRNCSGLTSITIPSGLTSIEESTFYGCSGLTSINIPSSVTSIDESAFIGCSGLASIIVDSGNAIYDSREDCNAIIETSSNELIVGCMNTKIPSSVTYLGYSAFEGCTGLTSITIPSSVHVMSSGTFEGCSGLTSIIVESGNTEYDSRENCNAIIETSSNTLMTGCQNTIIPSSVTSIEKYAFTGCTGLTSITIPSGVTSIGDYTFRGCSGLTSIIVDSENTIYDSREDCNAIIETSSNTLITGCQNTIIPSSVTSIGDYAFSECSALTSVTIPESVMSIAYSAFDGCRNITAVAVKNSTPFDIPYSAFPKANATLYVPKGSKAAYEAADYWKDFKEIVEMPVPLDENATSAPAALKDVDVAVLRTISANEWNTICLPFAMSEAQVKAAFGDDVQLGEFTGWATTGTDSYGKATTIKVDFSTASAIEANHPYIIKVSSPITSFNMNGVNITPETEPTVTVGSGSTLGTFTGSYVPMLIGAESLFLSGNNFWYSTGATQMKGYRGYFHFADVLAAYSDSAPVKMKFTLDGTTEIESIEDGQSAIDNAEIYDLAGRRVEKAGKGIYIINNKKVLVK